MGIHPNGKGINMNPIYVVLVIVLIIWFGIFSYLFYLHKKINTLLQLMKSIKGDKNIPDQHDRKG
jgi:CcmD family protein